MGQFGDGPAILQAAQPNAQQGFFPFKPEDNEIYFNK